MDQVGGGRRPPLVFLRSNVKGRQGKRWEKEENGSPSENGLNGNWLKRAHLVDQRFGGHNERPKRKMK